MNPKVDFYFNKTQKRGEELALLRNIALGSELTETLKWGVPCYTFENHNLVLIHVFKEYCAILFFKGALLTDEAGILIQQTENTQATRQIRFTSAQQILEMELVVKTYIQQAIEIEKSGLKVELKKPNERTFPEEFQAKLSEIPDLKTAFEALSPGRQNAYLLHFSQPKQSQTRTARIEKCSPQILEGKGLNDV